MPLPVALSLEAIRVRYGKTVALDGLSLDVRRGEIVGLLGPNGSGKSTALAVAAGVLTPLEGCARVQGIERECDPTGFAARIGLVPQVCALYDEFTAAENLFFFGKLYGLGGSELRRRVVRTLSRMRMGGHAASRVSTFSGGMKQRVNLAAALLHDPPVLLLDEPTASLDPATRDSLFADLTRLKDDGHAVLLSTHHIDEAELGCDRIAVLDRGKLVAVGPPCELFRCRPVDRVALYGHLREKLPKFRERAIRQRLGPTVEFDITGRRLRLSAETNEALGRALAVVLVEGVEMDTFRTPAGSVERVLRGEYEFPATLTGARTCD